MSAANKRRRSAASKIRRIEIACKLSGLPEDQWYPLAALLVVAKYDTAPREVLDLFGGATEFRKHAEQGAEFLTIHKPFANAFFRLNSNLAAA